MRYCSIILKYHLNMIKNSPITQRESRWLTSIRSAVQICLGLLLLCCMPKIQPLTTIKGDNIMIKRIGEEFEIKVSIENAFEITGMNAYITYDPAVIEVVDGDVNVADVQPITADLGFFTGATLLVGLEKVNNIEQPGTLICGYVSIPPTLASGTGDCFTVRFKAITEGTTNVGFSLLGLQDEIGEISANWVGDIVDVPANAIVRITVL